MAIKKDGDKKLLQGKYKTFKKSLPENLAKGKERDYSMRRNWRESGKPKDFKEAVSRDMISPVYHPEENKTIYHAGSTSPKTGKMYKPKKHESSYKELEGVRNSPETKEYKENTKLVSRGRYWKFKEKSDREKNNKKVAERVNKRTEKNYDKGISMSKKTEEKNKAKKVTLKK
jgi:hypothetical protein